MFRTSTKSKKLRIPRLEKIGLEGDLAISDFDEKTRKDK